MPDVTKRKSILRGSELDRRSVLKGTAAGLAGTALVSGTASGVEPHNSYYADSRIYLHDSYDTSTTTGRREENTGMFTIDGPVDNDGYTWWKVRINGDHSNNNERTKAWVAQKDMAKAHYAYGSGCYFTTSHCAGRNHEGVDIGCSVTGRDTHIYASQAGRVYTRENGCYGKELRIEHPNGHWTQYAHLSDYHDDLGSTVDKFEHVGYMGDTGCSNGVHLHQELRTCGGDDCEIRWDHDSHDENNHRIEMWRKTGITHDWWLCDCC
jgi:murein DD-endopeptidase MepM/ murein hydrolase activator NlpD